MQTPAETVPSDLTAPMIERALRFSYAQAMLGSVYAASVGGMFLIGYALLLGADNAQIGLMTTLPALAVAVQLPAAWLVERGVSRRRTTFFASLANVLGWLLIIAIPYVGAKAGPGSKIGALIAILVVVTVFGHIANNARGSWVGDLIPATYRGSFFGRVTMLAGLIGTVFSIVEGRCLDALKNMGIGAFSGLFAFGVLIGLANAYLFLPQPDIPTAKHRTTGFTKHITATFGNRPLMSVMLFAVFWSMQSVAAPFYSTFMIRDLKMSFLGIGLVNCVVTVAMVLAAPFWGRMADRYGCRAVLTACSFTLGALQLVWLWVDTAKAAYWIIPPANVIAGLGHGGVAVALTTLLYKVTPSAGRSVQFAIYAILVTLVTAPMPILGGHLPAWLDRIVPQADLRLTFYASIPFLIIAGFVARRIREPAACRTRVLLRSLPTHVLEAFQRVLPVWIPIGRSAEDDGGDATS